MSVFGGEALGRSADSGLEAGEGEIWFGAAGQGAGQVEAGSVAVDGRTFDGGAAGIAEVQDLCRLVERFPEGIIDGRAEAMVAANVFDEDGLGVAA